MLLIHRIVEPGAHPAAAATRCPDVLAAWLRHAPGSVPDPRCDFEDWAEPACILAAMDRRGPVVLAPIGPAIRYSGDRTPLLPSRHGAPPAVMWGSFCTHDSDSPPIDADFLWNSGRQVRRVQEYASSPVFRRRMGRQMHVCDMTEESIGAAVDSLREAGCAKGFAKTRDKGAVNVFDVDGRGAAYMRVLTDPYQMAMREGDRACVYIQSLIEPTFEYRTFVVGDRAVTGAGCIVEHTPVDNRGLRFDRRMEAVRGSGHVVESAGLAETYRAFAQEYAMEWAAEHGADAAYSLDLCLDAASGRVVPIEMNPLMNVGLYATDADALVGAMSGMDPIRTAA